MEHPNTLAAVYAARCNARTHNSSTATRGAERSEPVVDVRATRPAPRGGFDEAVLLDVLRRSAGPCDRVFASRLAFSLGAGSAR